MFLVSVLVFMGFTIMGMLLAGSSSMFIDVPSFLMVVPTALLFGIGVTSLQSLKNGFSLFANDGQNFSQQEFLSAAKTFSVIGTSAIWLGASATFIGWVAMGANIEAEEFSTVIGPAFAVSILTVIYGVITKVFCYVAEQKVLYKMQNVL